MTNGLQQIHYNDVMTDFASAVEQVGVRKFFMDFRESYPSHFDEIQIQITRLDQKPIAALLREKE
jgi:hypothetical protein